MNHGVCFPFMSRQFPRRQSGCRKAHKEISVLLMYALTALQNHKPPRSLAVELSLDLG